MTKSSLDYFFPRMNCPTCNKKISIINNKIRKHFSILKKNNGFPCKSSGKRLVEKKFDLLESFQIKNPRNIILIIQDDWPVSNCKEVSQINDE